MKKEGAVPSDARHFYDSAWTTAFTTARHSLDAPELAELDDEPAEPQSAHARPRDSASGPRPTSSRYSAHFTSDHMDQMIGEFQEQQQEPMPAHQESPIRHISQVYRPPRLPAEPVNQPKLDVRPKFNPRDSLLRASKSNEEMQSVPKLALAAQLEALRGTQRFPTPDLIDASGATDPRLALSSHPTMVPTMLPPLQTPSTQDRTPEIHSAPSLRTRGSRTQDIGHQESRSRTEDMSAPSSRGSRGSSRSRVKAPSSIFSPSPITPQVPHIVGSRSADVSPWSSKTTLPSYPSHADLTQPPLPMDNPQLLIPASAKPSSPSITTSNHASFGSWTGEPVIDTSPILASKPPFTDSTSPRLSQPPLPKHRDRKPRDRKASSGTIGSISSARNSIGDLGERVSPAVEHAHHRANSPTTSDAPPMPAVPEVQRLSSKHAVSSSSPRAGSIGGDPSHSHTHQRHRERSERTPPPPSKRPPPPPRSRTDPSLASTLPTATVAPAFGVSDVMLVAETTPQPGSSPALTPTTSQSAAGTGTTLFPAPPPSPRLRLRAPSPAALAQTLPGVSPGPNDPLPPTPTSPGMKRLSTGSLTSGGGFVEGGSARARIADLERKNALLEAALAAVLATAGRLNGCPCQGRAGGNAGGNAGVEDALQAYRATRSPSRLGVPGAL